MGLSLKDGGKFIELEVKLEQYCCEHKLNLELEWLQGQYWLKSDIAQEKMITIKVDEVLSGHEKYFKQNSIHKENLARAIGIKAGFRPKVLDLTGGLLGDSLMMLSMGAEVHVLERHPLVILLIQSALKNAKNPLLEKLKFYPTDALTFLNKLDAGNFDVIYFDPMFEEANAKTAPRKEMRIFRNWVGADRDTQDVIEAAKNKAKRLVIKRPLRDPTVRSKEIVSYKGKAIRYDVSFS